MIKSEKEKYWRDRADRYSSFKWANDRGYLFAFIGACEFEKHHLVLDAGCGPGIVSKEIRNIVNRVIGLDNSKDMLSQCDGDFNVMFGDVADNPLPSGVFDRVLARNVFHHMTKNLLKGIGECHRVLKPGGRIIIGERVPPSDEVVDEYRSMLHLKDKRLVFTEEMWRHLILSRGFRLHTSFPFWIKGFDVGEWLKQSGLDRHVQYEILDRHHNGSAEFKRACHMRGTVTPLGKGRSTETCIIDLKNIIIVGEKI